MTICSKMITVSSSRPRPVPVYGYDDTFGVIGGDPFEAETSDPRHPSRTLTRRQCADAPLVDHPADDDGDEDLDVDRQHR